MAQKKIIYDINGKIKESTGNYYDNAANTVTLKNVTFNTMSLELADGLAFANNTQISSSQFLDGDVIVWSSANNTWQATSSIVDVTADTPPAGSDVSGTFSNVLVKNLSNVNKGAPLSVEHGGTGLNTSSFSNGESLLVGNGVSAFNILTASNAGNQPVLLSTIGGWSFITQSVQESQTEVQIFTSSGNWYRPANTKMIRVLVQGAGGGGGSGANRNNANYIMGAGGGGAGGFVDSGIILLSDSTASIVVGTGGSGGVYPLTNSSGANGAAGGSSSFGSYIYANGGNGGNAGILRSTTQISGATAVAYGTQTIYDTRFLYNKTSANDGGDAGGNSTSTTGSSTSFTTSSTSYYGGGGGGGGGSLASNYIINYNGGNGGSIDDPVYLASGGGGGASATVTEVFDSGTLALAHFNINNPSKDNSAYNYSILSHSSAPIAIVSTSSLGIPRLSGTFSDGVVSSSNWTNAGGTEASLYFDALYSITGDMSMESWFYLVNTGSRADKQCYLFNVGYDATAAAGDNSSIGLFLTGSSGRNFGIFRGNGTSTGTLTSSVSLDLNRWNHVVLQKSGTVGEVFLNGARVYSSSFGAITPLLTNASFGYSLGKSLFASHGTYNFRGYAKELRVLDRAQSLSEIQNYYNNVISGNSGSYPDATPIQQSYPGGLGGNGAWGSGGGGGGASTNYTGSQVQQGGNGGDGYVAVISYKY